MTATRFINIMFGMLLTGAILSSCETRDQKWDRQSPGERMREGLKNPSNNPPGKGFNTSD